MGILLWASWVQGLLSDSHFLFNPRRNGQAAFSAAELRTVIPIKSPMHDALRYTLNQWEALRRYSDTGFVALDNNATERINKLIARGRVNWLFVGSPRGGETAARLLSLVVSCRRLHMDSFRYLRDVITRLPSLPADLLPARWLQSHPEACHPPERQGRGHADPRPRRRRRST